MVEAVPPPRPAFVLPHQPQAAAAPPNDNLYLTGLPEEVGLEMLKDLGRPARIGSRDWGCMERPYQEKTYLSEASLGRQSRTLRRTSDLSEHLNLNVWAG